MRGHFQTTVFFILLFCFGIAEAGQVDARTLRAQEKEVFESGDALMDILIAAAGRDMTCEGCRVEFQRTLATVMDTRVRHRSAVSETESDPTAGSQKKATMRFEAARTAGTVYTELRRRIPEANAGLCGKCPPPNDKARLAALKKEFGDSRGSIVASALADSLRMLRKASTALQRRYYDPTFGRAVDVTFQKWMAKPTNDNIRFAASCTDGILASLLRKSLDPGTYFCDPLKSGDPEVAEWGRDPNAAAFVVYGLEEIFLTPLFFTPQAWPSVFVHEESHLLYDATDRGEQRIRRGGMKPPRSKGTATLLDAYSIQSLVEELAKL